MNTQPASANRPACPAESPPSCHPPFCRPRSATPRPPRPRGGGAARARRRPTPGRTSSGAPGPSWCRRSGKVNLWVTLAGLLGVAVAGGVAAWLITPSLFARQRDDIIYFDVKEEPL